MTARRPATFLLVAAILALGACSSAPQLKEFAAEHYSLGMAYFELGKYAEAAAHFQAARSYGETRTASDYQLARILYETGKYAEAAAAFEALLAEDPPNTMLLKATAYAEAGAKNLDRATELYARAVELLPEDRDTLYNYALLLGKASLPLRGYELLLPYVEVYGEDADARLLLARLARQAGLVEAVDQYATYLRLKSDDIDARLEYAGACEAAELYAAALSAYDDIIKSLASKGGAKLATARFGRARLLLVAAGDGAEGLAELARAVSEGFSDREAAEKLIADPRLADSKAVREALSALLEKAPPDGTQAPIGSEGPAASGEGTPVQESTGEAP